MKPKVVLAALFISGMQIVNAQQKAAANFTLSGKLTGRNDGTIRLSYINKSGREINDTAILKNGAFVFRGEVSGPIYATLTGDIKSPSGDDPDFVQLFLAPANMTIAISEGDFKHAVMSGSKMQDDMGLLNKQKAELAVAENALGKELIALNGDGKTPDIFKGRRDSLNKIYFQYHEKYRVIDYAFIKQHPASYLSPYLMDSYFRSRKLSLDSAQLFYNSFTAEVKYSPAGKNINAAILARKASAIGSVAPVFTRMDINGKTLDLTSFRNKSYVLLDFWASWCVPCRAEGPQLKQIYKEYHRRGLEIVSISWDSKEKDWKDAIKQDTTEMYHHILGNMFLPGDVSMRGKYSIAGIPTFILIDKDGHIAGRYRGADDEGNMDDLEKKLAQALPADK